MNENVKNILSEIEKYLSANPNIRFSQALFNLGINEFADKINPNEKENLLRDIYNDADNDIYQKLINKNIKLNQNEKVEMFDSAFIMQLRMNAGDLVFSKNLKLNSVLSKRQTFYNNNFKYTAKKIEQLIQLNSIFKEKEKAVYQSCKSIENNILANNKKSKSPYTDYEINIELAFYSDKIQNKYRKYELDYIYKDRFILIFRKEENKSIDEPDNNWIHFITPEEYINPTINLLNSKINLCRTFFCLLEYSYLSLEDILLIDNIWWDVNVSNQFNSKL